MNHRSPQFLALLRRVGRPSSLVRGLWLAVALLHAWLVMRRVALGEWADALGLLRGGLCLLGVVYATCKCWRLALVFDAAPRRALVFGLILLIGHWLLAVPGQAGGSGPEASGKAPVVAVVLLVPALTVALLVARAARIGYRRAPRRQSLLSFLSRLFALERRPLSWLRHSSFLFHRPPPLLA